MGKLGLATAEPNPLAGRPSRIATEFDDEDRAEIIAAYRDDRRSAEWIALRIGVSATAVRYWLIGVGEWRGRNR